MARLKGTKFIEDFIDDDENNYAGHYFDPEDKEKYVKEAFRLSKKYPKATFGIIDYGRNSRGGGPNVGVRIGGKVDNPYDDIQGHTSSFNVGTFSEGYEEEVTGGDGGKIPEAVTFYKNGKIFIPKIKIEKDIQGVKNHQNLNID